jgi:hypothetical protein
MKNEKYKDVSLILIGVVFVMVLWDVWKMLDLQKDEQPHQLLTRLYFVSAGVKVSAIVLSLIFFFFKRFSFSAAVCGSVILTLIFIQKFSSLEDTLKVTPSHQSHPSAR